MLTKKIKPVVLKAKKYYATNKPAVLTKAAVISGLAAVGLTAFATVKAVKKLETMEQKEDESKAKFIGREILSVAPYYIPAGLMTFATVKCTISSNQESARRLMAASSAYMLSEKKLEALRNKVATDLGDKTLEKLNDAIAKDAVAESSVPAELNDPGITDLVHGPLCYDPESDRYFRCSPDKIRDAQRKLNQQLMVNEFVSLNEFYYEIGLNHIKLGDELGWNITMGGIDIDFSHTLTDANVPVLVLVYDVQPRYKWG